MSFYFKRAKVEKKVGNTNNFADTQKIYLYNKTQSQGKIVDLQHFNTS
jgi:hypothetical protein